MNTRLKILHIAPLTSEAGSGLNRSILALTRAQFESGAEIELWSSGSECELAIAKGITFNFWSDRKRAVKPDDYRSWDLAVFHSTYIPAHARIASHLRAAGTPYVVVPHGGMTFASRRVKRWKKRIGDLLFFNRLIAGARALHFLTQGEAAESQGWRKADFVVGNGVDPPPVTMHRRARTSNALRFVFIGRLAVQHKGLDLLLDGWARFRRELPDSRATLHCYGPDHEGGERWLKRAVGTRALGASVRIEGPVFGDAKEAALGEADVFVHTSRFEGCPLAVLEALARGVPCLLTPGARLAEEVELAGAGLAVGAAPSEIGEGLLRFARGELALGAMSEAALAWAARHSWDHIGRATLREYAELLK